MLWVVAIFLVAIIVWYALIGRRWLKTTDIGQRLLVWVEPVEIALFKKSETLLMGRLLWVGGFLVTAYDSLAVMATGMDLTPITSRLFSFVPEDLRGITVAGTFGFVGLIISWLRKRTGKPLEVIAAPTTPETVEAEAKVDVANAEAVVVADAAKAKAA